MSEYGYDMFLIWVLSQSGIERAYELPKPGG